VFWACWAAKQAHVEADCEIELLGHVRVSELGHGPIFMLGRKTVPKGFSLFSEEMFESILVNFAILNLCQI
jgi:hypothetical protein